MCLFVHERENKVKRHHLALVDWIEFILTTMADSLWFIPVTRSFLAIGHLHVRDEAKLPVPPPPPTPLQTGHRRKT